MEWILDRSMTPQGTQDAELVRRMAAGDEEALRRLYAAHDRRMYAYALRLTGDAATAEDVLQESLVAAWQGAKRFRGDSQTSTWLLGIVHHKAMNAIRRRERIIARETAIDGTERKEPPEHRIPDDAPTPDEEALASDMARLLRAGLDELSKEHRAVLALVFYHGLGLREVAEICRCPVGTVKSRLSYAKKHLRGILSRCGLGTEDTP
ncbi:MAG TPA: sigma-70 family RNA polymerase sigma factor [Chloroflexi bacterium]|jgi:RNA polymerase sigma-70 factor (ECF subfamily)|nr:sigma-70 family RNA polymerase sigma factor [Chloroflexota bacterium]